MSHGTLRRHLRPAAAAALLVLGQARAGEPLPEPLTLDAALAHADGDHPALALSRARLAALEADAARIGARDAIDIGASLEARVVDPPDSSVDQSHNDSRAILYAR